MAPYRPDRVYLGDAEIERLARCGCPTCAALLKSIRRYRAKRPCLRESALVSERTLNHLERALGRRVDLGDPTRLGALCHAASA